MERIGQPAVDLVNERGESIPFGVVAAACVLYFSLLQMFFNEASHCPSVFLPTAARV